MPDGGFETELTCAACGAKQRCGPTQMMQSLSRIGMLKRGKEPELDLLEELLRSAADRLPCQACGSVGLSVDQVSGDEWDDARACEVCRRPISSERLEIFPAATRCAACQQSSDEGSDQEREFCDACGSVMSIRIRQSAGPTRYEMKCPNCRK